MGGLSPSLLLKDLDVAKTAVTAREHRFSTAAALGHATHTSPRRGVAGDPPDPKSEVQGDRQQNRCLTPHTSGGSAEPYEAQPLPQIRPESVPPLRHTNLLGLSKPAPVLLVTKPLISALRKNHRRVSLLPTYRSR